MKSQLAPQKRMDQLGDTRRHRRRILLLLLNETRKLQTFPTEQVETIWLAGLLLYTVAISSLRVFISMIRI